MLGYLIIVNIERIFINYMAFLIRLFARFLVFELCWIILSAYEIVRNGIY